MGRGGGVHASDVARRHGALLVAAVGWATIVAAGCGPRGPERFHVEGAVTYAGKPLPRGVIRFEPDGSKGNTGPVGLAEIADGRFTTDQPGTKGSLRGPIVAVITGYPALDPAKEFQAPLVSEYRIETTLEPKGRGPVRIDFDVPETRGKR